MMGNGCGVFNGLGFGGGSSMMILFLAALGVIVYLAVGRKNSGSNSSVLPPADTHSDALDIAKMRLANGEITIQEFEQIRKNLL